MNLLTEKRPPWLRKRLASGTAAEETKNALMRFGIDTICEGASCPNLNECFSRKVATFLILGNTCTRSCSFCSVAKGAPTAVDHGEPARIAGAVRLLGLRYVVITSVTRDDLDDGGAEVFEEVINEVRKSCDGVKIEVLVPDFNGKSGAIAKVTRAEPDVFGHNIETVNRLYAAVRGKADYNRSLNVLVMAKSVSPEQITKSSIMLGLGESKDEIKATLFDIKATGCDMLTIGQYLQPGPSNINVRKFYSPEEFEYFRRIGYELGFKYVASGPFVRSSYLAEDGFKNRLGVFHDRG